MKIIDRVKAYIQEKKGRDPRSTGSPLGGAADSAPAQPDRASHERNGEDEGLAVSASREAPEPEPATESTTEPATEPVTDPAAGSATKPTVDSATEATETTEPATESVAESATEESATEEPATEEPATEESATEEPATESAAAPAACPRCGATGDAPCTTPSGKPTKTHKGRMQ